MQFNAIVLDEDSDITNFNQLAIVMGYVLKWDFYHLNILSKILQIDMFSQIASLLKISPNAPAIGTIQEE